MIEFQSWMIPVGIAVLSLVFYKFVLRVFFGLVIVPEDRIGLVTKKFVLFGKQTLPAVSYTHLDVYKRQQ